MPQGTAAAKPPSAACNKGEICSHTDTSGRICGQKEWVMSDSDFEYEDDALDQQSAKDPVRAHLRKVEAENKELRAIKAEAEAAKKELAFAKAGIDLSSKMAQYFVKAYDGELTPESIQTAAAEVNLINKPQPPQQNEAEKQAWSRVNEAARSGETSDMQVDWAAKMAMARNEAEVKQLLAQANAEIARQQNR